MNTQIKRTLVIVAFVAVAACMVPAYIMGRAKGHQEGVAALEQVFARFRYQAPSAMLP